MMIRRILRTRLKKFSLFMPMREIRIPPTVNVRMRREKGAVFWIEERSNRRPVIKATPKKTSDGKGASSARAMTEPISAV